MRRIFTLLFSFALLSSCAKKYTPRVFESVPIESFVIDSTSIRAIVAVDSETVYFAGSRGDVGYTNDGGKTWTRKFITYKDSIAPHFRSIAKNRNGLFTLSIGNPALLYKITEKDTSIVYKEVHDKVFYDAMQFFDDGKHGIAIGDPTEDCPSIIITKDGGDSWKKISCENLPKFEDGEAFFAASNTNIKTLGSSVWIASGGKKARVLRSDDYGKTWKIFDTPIVQGEGSQGIYSIDMTNFRNGIVFGGDFSKPLENNANKAITNDGGKTWTLVSEDKEPNYKSCVQYVPYTNGDEIIAVGKTGVSFSNDGGITWKKVSEEAFYAVQFVDKHTAWLSGNKKIGKLYLE